MAEPNISLLGATYSGVKGVTLPKSGGGTATFPWVEGSETKTQNGTYDVTTLAELIVNVSGSSGLVYESGTFTTSSDTAAANISFANTHSDAPWLILMTDVSGASGSSTSSNILFAYLDYYKAFGNGIPYSSSALRYESVYMLYRGSSGISSTTVHTQYNSDDTGDSSTSYARFWAKKTGFHATSNATTRYWRSGRTYKWIAVWNP